MNFFVEQIKYHLLEIAADYGLSYDWNAMVCSDEYAHDDSIESESIILSLSKLRMMFLTMEYCFALATIIAVIECLLKCCVKMKRRLKRTSSRLQYSRKK